MKKNKQTLTIGSGSITVDIDGYSKSLADIHSTTPIIKKRLKAGLLDSRIIMAFEKSYSNAIKVNWDETDQDLFKKRIEDFIKSTKEEIVAGIYKQVELWV